MYLLFVSLVAILACAKAFYPSKPSICRGRRTNAPQMLSEDDGYGPTGSLIRQGPVPYFIRLIKPDTYEAAVNKYMAKEKCSKLEAMANMG